MPEGLADLQCALYRQEVEDVVECQPQPNQLVGHKMGAGHVEQWAIIKGLGPEEYQPLR